MKPPNPGDDFHSRWLSQDFIEFTDAEPFDLVIVGSGYGAAMAAATFAGAQVNGKKLRIALLERGREYLPGAFPSTLDELPGHVRISRSGDKPIGRRDALFDVHLAGDVSALLASGLGGGSLINGGVMVEPDWEHFDSRLPPGVKDDLHSVWIEEARKMLGAKVRSDNGDWVNNSIDRHPAVSQGPSLQKTAALQKLEVDGTGERAAITVRMRQADNAGQASKLPPCTLCGDCLTGCNVGAKVSLDTNLLVDAQRRGMAVYTSASVLSLRRHSGLWALEVVHTNPQVQARRGKPVTVRAHKVVLAAGSLGSTEILLRSRKGRRGLRLSPRLGEQFSLNGDNTATVRFDQNVNALADENQALTGPEGVSPRRIGPEITHMLRWPADDQGPGFLVQEFSVPAPLKDLFQEIVTTRGWLDRLAAGDQSCHSSPRDGEHDPLALDHEALKRELMVGLIGHDSASGRIELPRSSPGEGSVRIRWPGVGSDPAMARAFAKLEDRVKCRLGAGGRVTPNPMWRLLPKALGGVVGTGSGGALTVHPLGGCPMGTTPATGVVNPWGSVFNLEPDPGAPWGAAPCLGTDHKAAPDDGSLLVLDGAIVPASLGANPSLTIAALSLRAARHWRDVWGWKPQELDRALAPKPRPRARALSEQPPAPAPATPTKVEIIERLSGKVDGFNGPHGREARWVELTFAFRPASIEDLTQPLHKRLHLSSNAGMNTLRIYRASDLGGKSLETLTEAERKEKAEVTALLTGHMDLLEREPDWYCWRSTRASLAFLFNRGFRDLMRYLRDRGLRDFTKSVLRFLRGKTERTVQQAGFLRRIWRLASHAGEIRHFEYRVQISVVVEPMDSSQKYFWDQALLGTKIRGLKRFTYAWRENPWNQLLYLQLQQLGKGLLPSARWPGQRSFPLKLDARFLAGQGMPLLRITEQANQVRALTDLAHLGLYWTRLFAKLHLWHLRQPDPSPEGAQQRLPGAIEGLPAPEITEIDLEPKPARSARDQERRAPRAVVRLTRYRACPAQTGQGSTLKPPLIFIHGYSTSGTTFAHEALEHPAAKHFWQTGRDIWLLDLRTSAGMPTAQKPWAFEDAAWADIPVAINHIAEQVGRERGKPRTQVDVFAHCIGAVMLSMALLTDSNQLDQDPIKPKRYASELAALPRTIRKLVLSQKGFMVEYTAANLLRAYLMNFVKGALRNGYRFRPSLFPRQRELVFDAFLNSLPYPPEQWRFENPWFRRVPWSATRRRMDALYERTFNIERMPRRVLEHIDDFFGPLNLETVSQVIHFARAIQISDKRGSKAPFDIRRLANWPRAGTLLLSAKDSGMVDSNTSERMEKELQNKGVPNVLRELVPGGHQDSLLGTGARDVWDKVEEFLCR